MVCMTDISAAAAARREAHRQSTGEFGEHARSAPELTLGPEVVSIATDVTVRYTQRDVIPPRMRKPRDIQGTAVVRAEMMGVASDEAPVVGSFFEKRHYADDHFTERPLRVVDGELFSQVTDYNGETHDATPATVAGFASASGYDHQTFGPHMTEDQIVAALHRSAAEKLDDYRIIDGTVWEKAGEPVYRVKSDHSFYFGVTAEITQETLVLPPGATLPDGVFLSTERDEAIAYARNLARGKGAERLEEELTNLPAIETGEGFTPGASVKRPPRIEYARPHDLTRHWNRPGQPYDTEQLNTEWGKFRDGLLAHPGAVIEVENPLGGATRTIERTALTEQQVDDFDRYQEIFAEMRQGR
jgi:hypothetical protein